MDFSFTPEQEQIRDTALRFAQAELAPKYAERERLAAVSPELRKAMGELGLIGVEFPEKFGGMGLDHVTAGVVIEAIAEGDFNVAYVQLLASLCGQIVAEHAHPDLAAEILPKVLAGETLFAIALTEPQGGSDAANLRLKARRDGDHYVLSGEKTSISWADQADWCVVFARTGTQEQGAHGISAFLVDLTLPGLTRTRFSDLGEHAIGRGSLFFDDVRLPAANMLGREGGGFVQVMQGFDFSRALIGLQCLSVARICLDETWKYIGERQAFGGPLSRNQGLTFPLAELDAQVRAVRLLCYQTLWAKTNHKPHTAEAAMVKWWAPKLAFEVVHRCLLVHGHAGYSTELPFEQRLRDVLGLQIGDGTAEIMKMIVARQALAQAKS
ncbi:MAG: cyclohexanecarboxyl-CoA dehydrogenase [Magnetospirillum sp.]